MLNRNCNYVQYVDRITTEFLGFYTDVPVHFIQVDFGRK